MKKKLDIPFYETYSLINMDETPCFLEMRFNTTIDFTGKQNIDIEASGREHYRISVILAISGNGYKLPRFIIVKGEPRKKYRKRTK